MQRGLKTCRQRVQAPNVIHDLRTILKFFHDLVPCSGVSKKVLNLELPKKIPRMSGMEVTTQLLRSSLASSFSLVLGEVWRDNVKDCAG